MSVKEEKRALAKRLIDQALDDGVEAEERNTFALRAIKVIRKYDLLELTPLDGVLDHPTVRAVKTVADKLADPSLKDGLKILWEQGTAAVAESRRRRRG